MKIAANDAAGRRGNGGVSMAEYHITRGPHGIYAGTRLKKTECTQEAIHAVRDYLIVTFLDGKAKAGGYRWKTIDGRIIAMYVHVTGGEHPAQNTAGKQADVAPVVRCRECKNSCEDLAGRICVYGSRVDCIVPDDFYCAYGAKMDGGADDEVDDVPEVAQETQDQEELQSKRF